MSIQLLLTLHVGKQKIQLQTSNNKKENWPSIRPPLWPLSYTSNEW
jgi:hypothetical protein